MTLTAIVRPPTAALARCELTYLEREPIDVEAALLQHAAYVRCLRDLGVRVVELPPEPDLPDSVFVEDTAVVVDEIAVVTLPGAESRRDEVEAVASAIAPYRQVRRLTAPAALDGGDVLRIGRSFYVGVGGRTNSTGIAQLRDALSPFGYDVTAVELHDCLHLKSACTWLGGDTVLLNPAWVDLAVFAGREIVPVAPDEPFAANTLTIGGVTLFPSGFPKTQSLLERRGYTVQTLDVSELQKAEAALTCLSILFDAP